jgi:hypothetical protein
LIVSFDFRYLPFDFSGIKLFEACSASFKTSSGKTQSFKHILQNCYFYKQPNVTMTPEHIMQTRFPTQKKIFWCLTGLKMIIGVAFCGCQAAKVTIYSEDEIGMKRRR